GNRVGLLCCAVGIAVSVSSCLSSKRLQENQKLLYRQTTEAPEGFSQDGLKELHVQKTNRRIKPSRISIGVGLYYLGLKHFSKKRFIAKKQKSEAKFDRKIAATKKQKRIANLQYRKQNKSDAITKKIDNGNLFMQWGEPMTIFDTAAMRLTKARMETYLFNRGYFQVHVKAGYKDLKKKRVAVLYTIQPGPLFTYDTIFYNIPDRTVSGLVRKYQGLSLIKKGDAYSQDKLGKERDRIDQLLKDHGYYDFSKQYIDFSIDTSAKKNKVRLAMEIPNPAKRGYHKQFIVDSVNFTTDVAVTGKENKKRLSVSYHNITFNSYEDLYSRKILAQRVFIVKDSLYSRTKTYNTQRQLANLDNFKFVNLNYDTTGGRFVANLFTSPLDRYSWGNEAGMTVTQGFPGPYISSNFKKRNVFGGLEILEINGRFGFEGVAAVTSEGGFYRSTEASGNASVTFPQFLFPFRSPAAFRYARNNPRTKILGGYTYTDRPEYQRSITTLSATYTWDLQRRLQFSFSPATLNVINSTISDPFRATLQHLDSLGNKLINAFKPSYVSSMIFSMTWNNNYGVAQKSSTFVRTTLESGGTLLNLYSPKFIRDQGLEPYQYFRVSFDFRKNVVVTKASSFAYRFNSGLGYAYSPNKVLPYEKNFFAGGSNGIRAWRPRRLGLGSDPPPVSKNISSNGYFDYSFEKPGQLLLEASVEWRQKLIGFVNYAFFVDAGNVWALQTTNNANASFAFNKFYKEIGVGTGLGLRFDFTFLILRFDVGIKAWDPARPVDHRFVLWDARFAKPYNINHEPVIYNIGIGYPF
ncbi:MAG TPA: BamA/TamA family outer membrane protein, partial [Cyclobacteriaceae bacterium]|nr:BamA/TamA family outer membrane protein [Cyclobacteriaceae bacterium]